MSSVAFEDEGGGEDFFGGRSEAGGRSAARLMRYHLKRSVAPLASAAETYPLDNASVSASPELNSPARIAQVSSTVEQCATNAPRSAGPRETNACVAEP